MKRLEVSGAVRPICVSLGVKRLTTIKLTGNKGNRYFLLALCPILFFKLFPILILKIPFKLYCKTNLKVTHVSVHKRKVIG